MLQKNFKKLSFPGPSPGIRSWMSPSIILHEENQHLLTLIPMIGILCSGTSCVNKHLLTYGFVHESCHFWDPWKQKRGDLWRKILDYGIYGKPVQVLEKIEVKGPDIVTWLTVLLYGYKGSWHSSGLSWPVVFQAIPRHGPGVNLCQGSFLVGSINVTLVLESKGGVSSADMERIVMG